MAGEFAEEDSSSELFADRLEIVRRKPEIMKFIWTSKEMNVCKRKPEIMKFIWTSKEMNVCKRMDCKLENLSLEPDSFGYFGRGRTGSDVGDSFTVNATLCMKLKKKYHTKTFVIEHGRIICIESYNCLTDSEVKEWKTEVTELFRAATTVKTVAWVARPDVIKFLQGKEGEELISNVNAEYLCIERTGHRNTDFKIVMGNIKDNTADVIVNSAGTDLSMQMGEVATCMSRTAGPEFQKDIQGKYPNGVSEGKVIRGKAGRLHCKIVYHAISVVKADEQKAIEAFEAVINKESRQIDVCREKPNKLLRKPECLLNFYVRFASDSMESIEKAIRQLEERLTNYQWK